MMSERRSVIWIVEFVVRDAHNPNTRPGVHWIGPSEGCAGSAANCQAVHPARGRHVPWGQTTPQVLMYSFQNESQAIAPSGKLLPGQLTAAAPTAPAVAGVPVLAARAAPPREPSPGRSPARPPPAAAASSVKARLRGTSPATARVIASNCRPSMTPPR